MLDGKERRDCDSRGFCSTQNVSTNHAAGRPRRCSRARGARSAERLIFQMSTKRDQPGQRPRLQQRPDFCPHSYAGGEDFGYFATMEKRVQSRLRSIVPWNRPGRLVRRGLRALPREALRVSLGVPPKSSVPQLPTRPRATHGRGGGEDDCYFVVRRLGAERVRISRVAGLGPQGHGQHRRFPANFVRRWRRDLLHRTRKVGGSKPPGGARAFP
jgi:hypothetical protein